MATKEADAVVSSMKLEKLLCMKGGKGEASYAKNSQYQGLVPSEKRDSFNVLFCAASLPEFQELVEANCSFVINKLEVFKGGSPLTVNRPEDTADVGRALAASCRSVCGVLVDAHIGDQLSEELFLLVHRRRSSHSEELLEKLQRFYIVAFHLFPFCCHNKESNLQNYWAFTPELVNWIYQVDYCFSFKNLTAYGLMS